MTAMGNLAVDLSNSVKKMVNFKDTCLFCTKASYTARKCAVTVVSTTFTLAGFSSFIY